jgi:PAS domain S-box-containing protein
MDPLEFNFSKDSFNKLFPFYILIDSDLKIKSFGKSLAKICPDIKNSILFSDYFEVSRPHIDNPTFNELVQNTNQLSVIKFKNNEISIRGQFELIDNALVFVGSPWFGSMTEVIERKLSLHDFALHDPMLDLLHVLNNQENTTQELKELLITINTQKNKLKQANKEIRDIALFPTQNPDPLIRIDTKGNLLKRNPAAEKLSSFVYDGISYETEDFFKFIITKIDLDKERWIFETQNGEKQYSFVCKSLKEENYVNIYGRDISLQKKAEDELNRLSLVASANQNGVVFTQPNGIIFWCNDAYLKLTGFSREEIIGKTPVEIGKNPDTNKNDFQKMIEPFYKGIPFDVDLMHARKDGSSFWSKNKGQPILNSKGEVVQFFAIIEDISLKKRYDESLQNEKEKYRSIIANMNLGLLEIDKNDVITLANQSFSDISGYTSEELIGKKASELLLTKESKELVKSKNSIRKNGKTDSYEVKVIDKFGKNKHWLISGATNYNAMGELIGTIGIHLDITEQKEQEEKLYLLSLIAEKNLNAVVVADANGNIEWANKSFIEISGYTMDEIIGKKPGWLLQGKESNPETISYLREQIKKGLPFNCEIINYSKQGNKYWIKIQGQALYNKKGQIIKFFAIEENITEKKELEEKQEFLVKSLAKSNKELEDYASIVSHDLKSPLRSIHSLISWIKEDNDKQLNDETLQYLSLIEGKVEKMDHLIEGILTYAKIDKVDVVSEKVNTHEAIENIINIIHIPSHIKVSIIGKLPVINADKFRIQQLFQNIIGNAVSYIDKPIGSVEVSCKEEDGKHIFSIKDNGPGIAKENQEKIFKTFQSLGKSDKSTGLGLSIVKKIIETYNGKIWLESEINQGTIFFIALNN